MFISHLFSNILFRFLISDRPYNNRLSGKWGRSPWPVGTRAEGNRRRLCVSKGCDGRGSSVPTVCYTAARQGPICSVFIHFLSHFKVEYGRQRHRLENVVKVRPVLAQRLVQEYFLGYYPNTFAALQASNHIYFWSSIFVMSLKGIGLIFEGKKCVRSPTMVLSNRNSVSK